MTKQHSAAVILQVVLVASAVSAFVPAPPALRSTTILGEVAQVRNRMERSASYSSGDSSSSSSSSSGGGKKTTTTRGGSPAAFGWGTAADARPATNPWGAKPSKADWSKLFAAPEPEPVQGRPLAVLSRSFAGAAQGSCYSSPLFLGMSLLLSLFSPIVAAQSLLAWGLGRATYWLSMRGEDVSRRMPAGFVGYASLFLVVGGLAFMNGLKGISALRI